MIRRNGWWESYLVIGSIEEVLKVGGKRGEKVWLHPRHRMPTESETGRVECLYDVRYARDNILH
jgi:hypothetical protein